MRLYETMFIVKPELTKEQVQAVAENYAALIERNGGQVEKVSDWGKRRLAYEINKYREGSYVLIDFQADAAMAKELERNFRISEDVIRYLIVRRDEEE
jgi:small subunit ribosomal protein S6